MEIITDIKQGSEEWLELRCGWVTASRFKDVIAGGAGKTRKSYMYQLAAESITDLRTDGFVSEFMEWGTKTEPQARSLYEVQNDVTVDEVSFIKLNTNTKIGCSPDGLVGDDGLVEFKCPKTTTQIETYLSGKMPACHKPQVQGQLWVSGREWCDFVSFDPRINTDSYYFSVRVFREETYIKDLESKVLLFAEELEELIDKLS